MESELPELRIGDRERRAVDAQLQEALADGVLTLTEYDERTAACWAARTRSDLDVLIRDLPSSRDAAPVAAGPPPADGSGPRRVTAVLSEGELGTPVVPGQPVHASAVLGTARVDLRREDLPREVRVRATAVLGEVKVQVPPGTTVHVTGGTAVLGERSVRTGPGSASGPVVHLDATAVLGTVTVDDTPRPGGLLPTARTSPGTPAVRTPAPPVRRGIGGRIAGAVATAAVVGAVSLGGIAVLGADDGGTVFGSHVETVRAGETDVEVGVLFGSVTVVVPDGVPVDTSGTVVFGSVECETACSVEGAADPIDVSVRGGFGSVEIVTVSERNAGDDD